MTSPVRNTHNIVLTSAGVALDPSVMCGGTQPGTEEIRVTWHRECYGFLETQPKNLCFLLRLDGEGRLRQGA